MNKPTVSQKALNQRQRKAREATSSPKPKRENIFSKSRDVREDRDMRQTKTDQPHTFKLAV